MLKNKNFLFGSAVFVTIVASRWMNIPNFNPVMALAVVGGAVIPSRSWSFALPMLALLLSDLGLAIRSADTSYLEYILTGGFLMNYVFYVAAVLAGRKISNHYRVTSSLTATLFSAVVFYLGSNLITFLSSGLYPLNGEGFLACYTAAIPFFGASLAANMPVAFLAPMVIQSLKTRLV